MQNPVRASCGRVATRARDVQIAAEGIRALVDGFGEGQLKRLCAKKRIEQSVHYFGDDWSTAQYLLVLDAINFCFWPDPDLHYHHLSLGLKRALLADPCVFDGEKLKTVQGEDVRGWLQWPRPLPLENERARLIREVGHGLDAFGGSAEKLIKSANKSALHLVSLLTSHFPGFRDHAVYQGEQVFFSKRAQIFVGDVWGSFGGEGIGEFYDMDQLTMFPDYRVPQFLQHLDILQYSEELQQQITDGKEIEAGSAKETEIRAATVEAVERIRAAFQKKHGPDLTPLSVQLDWWLWETAEEKQLSIPHHHTLTLYY